MLSTYHSLFIVVFVQFFKILEILLSSNFKSEYVVLDFFTSNTESYMNIDDMYTSFFCKTSLVVQNLSTTEKISF